MKRLLIFSIGGIVGIFFYINLIRSPGTMCCMEYKQMVGEEGIESCIEVGTCYNDWYYHLINLNPRER